MLVVYTSTITTFNILFSIFYFHFVLDRGYLGTQQYCVIDIMHGRLIYPAESTDCGLHRL